MRLVGISSAVVFVLGCGAPEVTYSKDVKDVLDRRCVSCHAEGGIGPFPLDSYAAVEPVKDLVLAAVEAGTMPPWLAGPNCNDYANDPTLPAEEKELLRKWVELGGPEGEPVSNAPASPLQQAQLSRIDLDLSMPEAYAPRSDVSDDYRCFLLDWPEQTDKFVTGIGVVPGDTQVVHHVIAYVVHPEDLADARAADDLEEGPGWTCFGGPSQASDGLGGWAPGTPPREFPAGTGIRVPAGSQLILEVHYHAPGIAALDQTRLIMKLEDQVEKQAAIIPVTNPTWLDGRNMLIPAGDPNVVHSFSVRLSAFVDEPFVIYDANAHMHKRGVSQYLWIDRANGDHECVLDVPRWDFDWQLTYILAEPKVVYPEDTMGITCVWDNSPENQPDDDDTGVHDVVWGEGTGDEMCIGFYYVTSL